MRAAKQPKSARPPFTKRDGPVAGQAGLGYRLSPSGLVLARVCCTLQPRIAGRRVLELGAGIGLPGLLCASLGAAEVVLTDYHPNLLTHLDQQTVHG